MTKRILHIVASLEPGGTIRQLQFLAEGLPRDEFAIQVVALHRTKWATDGFDRSGIKIASLGARGRMDLRAAWKLRQYIRRVQPDIVHTWTSAGNTYGPLAAISAGVPHIVATHRHVDRWKTGPEWALDRWLAQRSSCVTVNSIAVRDFYLSRGLPAEKLRLIASGVSAPESASSNRVALLAELGLPENARLIAYLGSLTKDKRLKELIWATDQLKAVGVPAHLLVIGDGPMRPAWERYRFLNHVDDRVHFLSFRDDVPRLLAAVEVVWQAGAQEGHSQAILDALAAGIPVVAADAAGNRELVMHGVNGYLVPLKERAGFARWTLPLLEDAALAQRMRAATQQSVQKDHRVENLLAGYAKLYRSL